MGPEKFGVSAFAIFISGVSVLLFGLNLDAHLIRTYLALDYEERDAFVRSVFWGRVSILIVGCMVLVGYLALAGYSSTYPVAVIGIILLTSTQVNSGNWILQANGKVDIMMRGLLFQGIGTFITSVLVVSRRSPYGMDVLVSGLMSCTCLFHNWFYAIKVGHRQQYRTVIVGVRLTKCWRDWKGIYMSGQWLFYAGAVTYAYTNMEQAIIKYVCGNAELGVYKAAGQLSSGLSSVVTILPLVYYPVFLKMIKEKRRSLTGYVSKLQVRLFRFAIGLAVLSGVLVLLSYKYIFGVEYSEGQCTCFVLILSRLVVMVNFPAVWTLRAAKEDKFLLKTMLIIAVFSVCANYFAVSFLGGIGAAMTNFISELWLAIRVSCRYKKIIDI